MEELVEAFMEMNEKNLIVTKARILIMACFKFNCIKKVNCSLCRSAWGHRSFLDTGS